MRNTFKNYKNMFIGLFIGIIVSFICGLTVLTVFHNKGSISINKNDAKSSGVSPIRARIAALQTVETGNATLNTTYVSGTNAEILYQVKGGWAFVMGRGLIMKNGTTTGNHSFQVATGLPKPASGSSGVYVIPTGYAGTYTKQVNEYGRYLWINANGQMTLYTWGTLATEHYFSVVYPVAAS